MGVQIAETKIPAGTADVTPQMAAALQGKPDFLMNISAQTECIAFLKAYRTAGSTLPFAPLGTCTDKSVLAAADITGGLQATTTVTTGNGPEATMYRAFLAKYAPNIEPSGAGTEGYVQMMGLLRAMKGLTGDVTKDTVLAQIRATKAVPLPLADGITFTCDATAAPPFHAQCSAKDIVTKLDKAGNQTVIGSVDVTPVFKAAAP
jgi:branched-chain amino acid transport system substrate-binding protein